MNIHSKIWQAVRKILPIAVGIAGSFATLSSRSSVSYYGVAAVDIDYYYIAENLFNKEEGIDYVCDWFYESTCVIFSLVPPDEYYRIPKITAYQIKEGKFSDMVPY